MGLFDVHAHLTDPRLASQEAAVLARAAEAGLTTVIANGLNPDDNARVLELAERSDMVRPAIGLYPVDAVLPQMLAMGIEVPRSEDPVPAADAVQWVRDHVDEAFAIGEIGLDGYWVPQELWEPQEQAFRALVQLAIDVDKPVIIHTRKRERRALEVLLELGATRVNWHCFGSKVKLGRAIASHPGQYLSIPAIARKAENFKRLIETLPRDRVLLETDCPYLAPQRGDLNEPANVAVTVELMAESWGCSTEAVVTQLEENFEALFGVAP